MIKNSLSIASSTKNKDEMAETNKKVLDKHVPFLSAVQLLAN